MVSNIRQYTSRILVLVGVYLILLVLPQYLAFWVRFSRTIPSWGETLLSRMAPWSVLTYLLVFTIIASYRRKHSFPEPWTWKVGDVAVVGVAKLIFFYLLVHGILRVSEYPRSVFLIESVFFVALWGLLSKFTGLMTNWLGEPRTGDFRPVQGGSEAGSYRYVGSFYTHGALLTLMTCAGFTVDRVMPQVVLPYSNKNPVIYDNDDVIDCYTDDYIMALASAGSISLVGMMTSTSIAPFNKYGSPEGFQEGVARRSKGVIHARNSGFRAIPDPVPGPMGHLQKPVSGEIQDTRPIGSEGSRLIIDAARKTTAGKPLVVVVGGPLTAVADAYLLDNSIHEKLIVAWVGGTEMNMADYNGWADPWAAYIVLRKLKLVQFPGWNIGMLASPRVPKSRLYELADSELRRWMIGKYLPTNGLPAEKDVDAPPAISLMRPDYVLGVKRVSFSHWITAPDLAKVMGVEETKDREFPAFKDDPIGTALVVTKVVRSIATHEWWRALRNIKAWNP